MTKRMKIAVINGSNINILGKREPDVYGTVTWENIEQKLKGLEKELDIELLFYQSNHEGDIVDYIQKQMDYLDGVVINPAAFTKAGYSILDALTAIDLPFVEVHLSNIFAKGGWHADSIFTANAVGLLCGFQDRVYPLGVQALYDFLINNICK